VGWQIYLQEEVAVDAGDYNIMIERGGTKKKPTIIQVGIKRVDGYDRKIAELSELCSRFDIKKYFMNLKYDKHRLQNLGIQDLVNAPIDVAVAAHVIDSEKYTNATLSQIYTDFTVYRDTHKGDFTSVEKADMLLQARFFRDKLSKYACLDAVVTLRSAIALKNRLTADPVSLNYFIRFAMPIETELLYELECNGVLIDRENLPVVKDECRSIVEEAINEFIQFCPARVRVRHEKKFRLTRRMILTEALFIFYDKDGDLVDLGYGIEPRRYSDKTKLPVCDKRVLQELLMLPSLPSKIRSLISAFKKWSEYNGLLTRYFNNLDKYIHTDNRIYPSYSITYTSSGRTGARKPSIQNFPKRGKGAEMFRKLLIAPQGKKLAEIDYSMAELRFIAHVAKEDNMISIIKKGEDIHLRTGADVAGFNIEGLSKDKLKEIRQNAKALNFGLPYGMSANGFRSYALTDYGLRLTKKEAEDKRDKFFRLYPRLLPWHQETLMKLYQNGYIRTVFGRKRMSDRIFSSSNLVKKQSERAILNAEIQGPSSDCTLLGGYDSLKDSGYKQRGIKLIAFIHDAFFLEAEDRSAVEDVRFVQNKMESVDTKQFGFDLSVPLVADVKIGDNFYDMEEI